MLSDENELMPFDTLVTVQVIDTLFFAPAFHVFFVRVYISISFVENQHEKQKSSSLPTECISGAAITLYPPWSRFTFTL